MKSPAALQVPQVWDRLDFKCLLVNDPCCFALAGKRNLRAIDQYR